MTPNPFVGVVFHWLGGLADNPIGQWNTFRIIQVGARTTVYLNGKLVVDHAPLENYWDRTRPIPAKGPIELQTHGSEIRWRNIKVREIPADEANTILSRHQAEGFTSIFNGRDLDGWGGPVDQYRVKDGVLMCKPKKGGTIYYNKELSDFVARLEFRLPPRRQQWPGNSLSRRGRHGLRRYVRAADSR